MNKHREHVKKLSRDVQTLGKKLEEVLREDGESIVKEDKIAANNKMSIQHSSRSSSNKKVSDQRKTKGKPCASVEVTVKTKSSGKHRNNNSKSVAPVSTLSNLSVGNKLESHCSPLHSNRSSFNKRKGSLIWENILKNSETSGSRTITNTNEDERAKYESKKQQDESGNEQARDVRSCPNCKNLVAGGTYSAQPDNGGRTAASIPISSLRHDIACQAGMKNSNFETYISEGISCGILQKGKSKSKLASQMNPIETLSILMQELNQKLSVEDESMRKLTGEMQSALGNLIETMSEAGFYSGPRGFSNYPINSLQLDLLLKSVDRVTAKESEYHSLLVSLVDKVKNLEEQVKEQRKGTDQYLLQNNILKEQNSVIPTLKSSQDLLQKRLQQNIQDYEKLKVDYHLLKLEKEKYCALNDAKDKEIKWFQQEIRNLQLLVEEQKSNLRKVDRFETTTNKGEELINLIDGQANLIKSKLGLAKSEEESSYPYILSPSIEALSPKFASKKQNSSPSSILELGKLTLEKPSNTYPLNVPELQSPNSS